MFCYQCQETMGNKGCNLSVGVCGKKSVTSDLQDLLLYTVKGVVYYSSQVKNINGKDSFCEKINRYIVDSLFMTITNANFNDEMIIEEIKKGLEFRRTLKEKLLCSGIELDSKYEEEKLTTWSANTKDEFLEVAKEIGVLRTENEDIRSLRELLTYGLKGMAAYIVHALNLNQSNPELFLFVEEGLLATEDDTLSIEHLTALVLRCGEYGVKAMALLDTANTTRYGNPEITQVRLGVGKRPGILISGHDLSDLEELLIQSEESGVDIYSHSEMLPGHYYPELKKYKHFIGNYGNAWWKQKEEFESFNGPILFTTNCIVPPVEGSSYSDKVFTTNIASYPGWKKIVIKNGKKDFSEIIEKAKTCESPIELEGGEIVGGFAHNQVFELIDKVIDSINSGAIKKFIVMAGCDGRSKSRNYYEDFAQNLPMDTIILTAGCAKYRYNKLGLGEINGIPRVLDAGQCNDSYSLAVIALKLKEIFKLKDINDLPIIYNIAWYEQKAVIVLLALLSLGIKKINLGPTLPAFLSPNVVKLLKESFELDSISDVETDFEKWGINK